VPQLKSPIDTSNFEDFPEEEDENDDHDEPAQPSTQSDAAQRQRRHNREGRPGNTRKKDPRFIGYTYRNARFGAPASLSLSLDGLSDWLY
jgi:hypothetical protein